jgi:hypothetical protein
MKLTEPLSQNATNFWASVGRSWVFAVLLLMLLFVDGFLSIFFTEVYRSFGASSYSGNPFYAPDITHPGTLAFITLILFVVIPVLMLAKTYKKDRTEFFVEIVLFLIWLVLFTGSTIIYAFGTASSAFLATLGAALLHIGL